MQICYLYTHSNDNLKLGAAGVQTQLWHIKHPPPPQILLKNFGRMFVVSAS